MAATGWKETRRTDVFSVCRRRCREMFSPAGTNGPRTTKAPPERGFRCMRRRGLEPPPGYPGPGPQPGASTNSAIGARATASIARRAAGLSPSAKGGTLCEHTFGLLEETQNRMDIGKDLTKRQQEIFDFIKRYSASHGYPPTVRDIGKAVGLARPRRCTRTWRTWRRSGCCVAIRPSRGRSSCWTRWGPPPRPR